MENFGIPLAALIVSLAVLVFQAITWKAKANESYVVGLEKRLEKAEGELRLCEEKSARLERTCERQDKEIRDLNELLVTRTYRFKEKE